MLNNDLIKNKLTKRIGTNELPCFSATNDKTKILGSCVIKLKKRGLLGMLSFQ